jgi:predicted nucleotidyltransferase
VDLAHPLAVVTPTLDGDILAVLALVDVAFTPGQLHRMLSRHSEDGIRRALRRLAGQGIVSVERAGSAYLYRLSGAHLAAEPIRALAQMRQTLLTRLEQRLESWVPAPVYGAVFGSAARGGMRNDSDIDLLLVRPDECDRDHWDDLVALLSAEVTAWTGNDTRVLELSESEVLRSEREQPVLRDVVAHGMTVVGPAIWLRRALRTTESDDASN